MLRKQLSGQPGHSQRVLSIETDTYFWLNNSLHSKVKLIEDTVTQWGVQGWPLTVERSSHKNVTIVSRKPSQWWTTSWLSGDHSVSDAVIQLIKKVADNGRQVHRIVSCMLRWPLRKQSHCWHLCTYRRCFVLQYPTTFFHDTFFHSTTFFRSHFGSSHFGSSVARTTLSPGLPGPRFSVCFDGKDVEGAAICRGGKGKSSLGCWGWLWMLCWRAGRIGIRAVHGWLDRCFRGVLDGNWCGWRWPLGAAILARRWVRRGCAVVVLVVWVPWRLSIQVVPIHVLSMNLLLRWRLGGLVRLGSGVVGGGSLRWWALVAGGRGWHLPGIPNGRLVPEAWLRWGQGPPSSVGGVQWQEPLRGAVRCQAKRWSSVPRQCLESTCARGRGSISHENMGRNLRFWTLEICLPYHESPPRTLGTPDATLATFWKRTFGTSTNELDDQIWTIFSSEALAWLEGGGCRCWPVDDGGAQFYQILYTVVEFVSQVVYIFILFVLVRALKWAAFSACEPQTDSDYQGAEACAVGSCSVGWHRTRGAATKLGGRQVRGCPGGIRCGLSWPWLGWPAGLLGESGSSHMAH